MMSCGEAAVPTLTSVERERGRERAPHSFQSVTQRFWLHGPNLPLQLPLRSSIPNILLLTTTKISNAPSFSSHSYWMRTLLPFRCNNNGGQTRSAVSARLHLGCFVSLKGSLDPMDLLRSDAKWSVCPGPTAAIYFTERYVEPRDGYSIIFSFAWHADWELQ